MVERNNRVFDDQRITEMQLFLSSKGLINEEITESFVSLAGERRNASIITTASIEFKNKNRHAIGMKQKLTDLGFTANFIDIEFENPENLRNSEIFVITGGNPYYLLHHIKKSKSDQILKQCIEDNGLIMGISAGLLVLMKNLTIIDVLTPEMNTIKLANKNGMGLINDIIIPHYDRFVAEGKINEADVDNFEKQTESHIIRLGEYQCIKYMNGNKEIIGELMK